MNSFWSKPIRSLAQLINGQVPQIREVRHWPSASLKREVSIDLYLPPSYDYDKNRNYPLVVFNDGQDLPVMQMQQILAKLYKKKQIPHLIVVGIHAADRMQEYGTALMPDYKGRGARADHYRTFMLKELLPWLRNKFRIEQNAESTALAGFSLGGLSAFDIAYGVPNVFGVVGVFSGSFWWRNRPSLPHDPDAGRIMHELVSRGPLWGGSQRYWMQVGGLDETDDRNNNGIIDAIDDTVDLLQILREKDVSEPAMRYLLLPEGRHDQATWAAAMPDFLIWALNSSRSFD
jgi:predicted alpha/beta superfamily hydrolase